MRNLQIICCMLVFVGIVILSSAALADATKLPKKIYAHYMGCWPIANGALPYSKQEEAKVMRDDSPDRVASHGGHVRNWDLVPYGTNYTLEQSADLEIRRALRIGIDGFAVDAWAGGDNARRTLDALFKVAEEKNYPFELTICIDPTCGGDIVTSVKEMLDKHGHSAKLARRDGKPLVFGYQSIWSSLNYLKKQRPNLTDANLNLLRTKPEGWELMGDAYEDASKQLGQPIYWHLCLGAFYHGVNKEMVPKDGYAQAAAILAKHVQAVGAFTGLGAEEPDVAKAVKAAGAEWSTPLGMFQKENIPYELYGGKGLDWMVNNWENVRKLDTSLLQIDHSGYMVAYDKTLIPDKVVLAADYASGDNAIGGGGVGLYYYFTKNIAILAGPVWFNDKAINGKMKLTMQVDINF